MVKKNAQHAWAIERNGVILHCFYDEQEWSHSWRGRRTWPVSYVEDRKIDKLIKVEFSFAAQWLEDRKNNF
jgi:hypothetical protein